MGVTNVRARNLTKIYTRYVIVMRLLNILKEGYYNSRLKIYPDKGFIRVQIIK